jgi:hypothetical protein
MYQLPRRVPPLNGRPDDFTAQEEKFMTRYLRWLAVGGVASALVAWSLALATNGTAADEDTEAKNGVLKVADSLTKNDMAAADKQAQALAKKLDDIAPAMDLMKPRGDGGLGVGTPKQFKHDGIDKELLELGKLKAPMPPAQLKDQGDALSQLGDRVAAIALVAKYKCPVTKKEGDKDPRKWAEWCNEMQKSAREFAAAAKARNAAKLKTVTNRLYGTCNDCHGVFRDN